MNEQPETAYADGPEGRVAYQVWGGGTVDLVVIPPWNWTIEVMWEEPRVERYLQRLGGFCRVIAFDQRGTGVSDPVPLGALPSVEQWTEDIRVVMDAAKSERAAVLGMMESGQMALMFAGIYPERTQAVIVMDGAAAYLRDDEYPIGLPERLIERSTEAIWGPAADRVALLAPSLAHDQEFRRWWAHFERLGNSPTVGELMFRVGTRWDARAALPLIGAPTLVLHHRDNRYMRPAYGKYVAEHVRDAIYVELPGGDCLFFAGDQEASLGEIQALLTGMRDVPEPDRVLATVLFTDIVSSTEHAAEMGDERWKELLDLHDRLVSQQVSRARGRLIKTTGDGMLATFDGPARATRCAATIIDTVRTLGLEVRAGLHAGEVELRDDDIGGIAVHLAARVVAHAAPGEVLVSSTVRDLVVGSGIIFDDRGEVDLRGIPGQWRLFAAHG